MHEVSEKVWAEVKSPPEEGNERQPVIDMQYLSKCFGCRQAVRDLTLSIMPGEIFGLLGPNGSGKTTTINLISGLAVPTSGQVRVLGYDVRRQARQIRRLLGTVPQETALYEELSARHNLEYHAALYGVPRAERHERIQAMLALVHLSERQHARVHTFSGGMKRRLALARALLHQPKVLYLDEPTLGVDPQNRHALYTFIRSLPAQDVTVLLTTNDLHEAEILCTRVAILDHGVLQTVDTPRRLRERHAGACHMQLTLDAGVDEELLSALSVLPEVTRVTCEDETDLHIASTEQTVIPALLARINDYGRSVRHLAIHEGHLEEAFLQVTGSLLRD